MPAAEKRFEKTDFAAENFFGSVDDRFGYRILFQNSLHFISSLALTETLVFPQRFNERFAASMMYMHTNSLLVLNTISDKKLKLEKASFLFSLS